MTVIIVTTTVGSEEEAEALASALVEARLAACVQMTDIKSCYRWEELQYEREVRLEIKTALDRREVLLDELSSRHPYDEPEILVTEAAASGGYADWVKKETRPS